MATPTRSPFSGPSRDAADLIALDDVRLSLRSAAGEVTILQGVTLRISAGETVSVVGPSGAGKSTLMMVIAGLENVSSGMVRVAGRDLTGLGEDDLAEFRRDTVGIVFQAFRLIPTMTALENVAIPLELTGAPDAFARSRESLGLVGLSHRVMHYPDQLSGGEQQRVAIARAFAGRPALLLADEPTGNLDSATGTAVMDMLFDLQARHGTTLILITHDRDLASRCDRVLSMADGRVDGQQGPV